MFGATLVAGVKAMACSLPAEQGVPLSRWSCQDLTAEAMARGITETVSGSTIRRWLAADAIKPWRHQSWIFPRDPDFTAKAARVLDLYDRVWNGRRLRPDEYVISADEKSQLQALHRRHTDLPPGPERTRQVEFEYVRGGILAYLAALDIHHATVIGRCAPTTGIVPFSNLVEQVMTQEPYASARRVFWVVDNGSSHAGQASIDRMRQAWPTAELVHLPVHASWLNQIEISSIMRATTEFTSISPRPARACWRKEAARKHLAARAHRALNPLRANSTVPSAPAERLAHRRTRQHLLDADLSMHTVQVPDSSDVAIGVPIAHVPRATPARGAVGLENRLRVGYRLCGNADDLGIPSPSHATSAVTTRDMTRLTTATLHRPAS